MKDLLDSKSEPKHGISIFTCPLGVEILVPQLSIDIVTRVMNKYFKFIFIVLRLLPNIII
jgi:hypothetical protein